MQFSFINLSERPLFAEPQRFDIEPCQFLILFKPNVISLVFINRKKRQLACSVNYNAFPLYHIFHVWYAVNTECVQCDGLL